MKAITLFVAILVSYASALPPRTYWDDNEYSQYRKTALTGPTGFTATEVDDVRQLLKDTAAMAKAAFDALDDEAIDQQKGRPDLVREYFKFSPETDEPTMTYLRSAFHNMYKELIKQGKSQLVEITKTDSQKLCNRPMAPGYAIFDPRTIVLCSPLIRSSTIKHDLVLPDKSKYCGEESKVTTMLMLMANIPEMGLPIDHTARVNEQITEYEELMRLNKWQSVRNSRTFGLFAQAVDFELQNGKGSCTGAKAHLRKAGGPQSPRFQVPTITLTPPAEEANKPGRSKQPKQSKKDRHVRWQDNE